jgi:hypothetical protein
VLRVSRPPAVPARYQQHGGITGQADTPLLITRANRNIGWGECGQAWRRRVELVGRVRAGVAPGGIGTLRLLGHARVVVCSIRLLA